MNIPEFNEEYLERVIKKLQPYFPDKELYLHPLNTGSSCARINSLDLKTEDTTTFGHILNEHEIWRPIHIIAGEDILKERITFPSGFTETLKIFQDEISILEKIIDNTKINFFDINDSYQFSHRRFTQIKFENFINYDFINDQLTRTCLLQIAAPNFSKVQSTFNLSVIDFNDPESNDILWMLREFYHLSFFKPVNGYEHFDDLTPDDFKMLSIYYME